MAIKYFPGKSFISLTAKQTIFMVFFPDEFLCREKLMTQKTTKLSKVNFSPSSEASLQCNSIKAPPSENDTLKLQSLCTNHNCHRKLKVFLFASSLNISGFVALCNCHIFTFLMDDG